METISQSTSQIRVQNKLLRNVYLWMFLGLLVSAVPSYFVTQSVQLQRILFGSRYTLFILMIAELVLVFYLSSKIAKMKVSTAVLSFLGYAFLNGLTLSSIFFVYSSETIVTAFLASSAAFASMSIYGMFTKRDLSKFSTLLNGGLIALVVVYLIVYILRLTGVEVSGLTLIISYVGVFLFMGLTAWDSQAILKMSQNFSGTDDQGKKIAIIGALKLYLDFINMFLFLLRIFGSRD